MSSPTALRDCPTTTAAAAPWCASAGARALPDDSACTGAGRGGGAFVEHVFDAGGSGPTSTSDALACRCGPAEQWPAFEFEVVPSWERRVLDAFAQQCGNN